MKLIKYPERNDWKALVKRPVFDTESLEQIVKPVLEKIKNEGDSALKEFTLKFDKVALDNIVVSEQEIKEAGNLVSEELKKAIKVAANNIEKFHSTQKEAILKTETSPGVTCWRKSLPIQNVGLYIPGGTAPLFSTILMLALPAKIAGCENIFLCTPPSSEGTINPAILYAASVAGINKIYKAGGAQAIAAMAFGTETIPKADKIFGPGNQFVTAAKQMITKEGVAIDMPAGPSEVAVLGDKNANPVFIAADLLSQAEHGADSQVLFISDDLALIQAVEVELEKQLAVLPRKEFAQKSLNNSKAILVKTMDEAMDLLNLYAPEHLILQVEDYENLIDKIKNAGSVFLGAYTPEAAGDYASGTNHTLPTNGYAKSYSGVSLDSFVKKVTFQHISKQGINHLGPHIEIMAEAEQLMAHKNAVSVRLK